MCKLQGSLNIWERVGTRIFLSICAQKLLPYLNSFLQTLIWVRNMVKAVGMYSDDLVYVAQKRSFY